MSEWQWASLKPHKFPLQDSAGESEISPKQVLDLGNLEYMWQDHHQQSRSHFAALLGNSGGGEKIQVSKRNYFGQQTDSGSTTAPSCTGSPSWRTAGGPQLAALVAQQSVANCDLPPPSSSEAAAAVKQLSRSGGPDVFGEALCRSQTRAREAESMALRAVQEKEQVMQLFVREASMTLAYRQWLVLLQAENMLLLRMCKSGLSLQRPGKRSSRSIRMHRAGSSCPDIFLRCTLAFAVGLGLASAGLMLGWSMGWIMFAL